MSWFTPRADRSAIPPMGQGLAVIALLVGLGIVMAGAVIGYLVSLHVAGANSRGRALDRRLAETRAQVRALEEEIDFRTRFVQLEQWRAPLGLQALDLGQYAATPRQLVERAAARQQRIAFEQAHPCGPHSIDQQGLGAQAAATCAAGPAGHKAGGYAPQARQQLDGLVGTILN